MKKLLRLQGRHYQLLKDHLFPGDGKEAVAVLLCGRHESNDVSILLSHQLVLIPHDECEREKSYVKWKTERLLPFFEQAEKRNFAIVKIHSHPTGYPHFSDVDDAADALFFPAAFSWSGTTSIHASAIMLPEGKIFGRVHHHDNRSTPIDRVAVAGDEVLIWDYAPEAPDLDAFSKRTIQAFGEGTYAKLKTLKIAVIGCSGTGSPTIEQLVRLGVGTLVLADPDLIEEKNLNRIINSEQKDVGRTKVSVLAKAVEEMGLKTKVIPIDKNLYEAKEGLLDIITCDILIGCVDSVDGRHLVSQLSNFYLIPYFDLGVRLIADGRGGVNTIVGSIHYQQPGMSTLLSRGLYTTERLGAESLRRTDPEAYTEQVKQKYIQGVDVERPAVISINMLISSFAVLELLNRLHPFKDDNARSYARVMIDYCGSCMDNSSESSFPVDENAAKWAGRGDCKPFLRMPDLEL